VSATEPEQTEGSEPFSSVTGSGDFLALDFSDAFAAFASMPNTESPEPYLADFVQTNMGQLNDTELATITDINTDLMSAWRAGYVQTSDIPEFFHWMFWSEGVATITPAMVADQSLMYFLYAFAVQKMYTNPVLSPPPDFGPAPAPYLVPAPPAANGPWEPLGVPDFAAIFPQAPASTTFPSSPPAPTPTTPGGHVVKTSLANVKPTTVTMAGVDAEIAKAISAAMQVETNLLTGLVAQAVDQALGGLQPGQAKSQMLGTANSVSALKRSVAALQADVASGAVGTIPADLATITAEVNKLISQMDLSEPSALDSHVNDIGNQVNALSADVSAQGINLGQIMADIPGLATVAALGDTQGQVNKLISQMDLSEPSALDSHLNAVDATATDALRVAEDAEQCCEAQTGNLQNLQKNLGGSSGIGLLGKLAGLAFGLPFLLGLADTLLALADMPAVIKASAWDAEVVAGYAESAAGVIMADFDWAGGWNSGG
jgi:hypothetical protein